jgi:hypothetical protein
MLCADGSHQQRSRIAAYTTSRQCCRPHRAVFHHEGLAAIFFVAKRSGQMSVVPLGATVDDLDRRSAIQSGSRPVCYENSSYKCWVQASAATIWLEN